MRFPIDFEDAEQPDIYELTNRKVNLNNNEYFGRGGTMVVTMSYDAFNKDKDKRVVMEDGKQVWVCDYIEIDTNTPSDPTTPPENPDEMTDLRAVVSGNKNLKVGFSRTYTATITDADGNAVEWDDTYSWNVVSDFEVGQEIDGNTIKLLVEDDSLIGESFLLSVIKNNIVLKDFEIFVVDAFY